MSALHHILPDLRAHVRELQRLADLVENIDDYRGTPETLAGLIRDSATCVAVSCDVAEDDDRLSWDHYYQHAAAA